MNDTTTAVPRPPFKVAGTATVKHLNVRKEGPEDNKVLAVDVKLSIQQVDRRLCAYFDEALEAFLWRGNTDALIVRNYYLAPPTYGNLIEGATVVIGGDTFYGCDVKKFSLEPFDGGVLTLTCSVTLFPSSSDVSALAKIVQDDTNVEIEGPPDLFAAPLGAAPAKSNVLLTFPGASVASHRLDGETDPMYDQALAIVREKQKASISLVQRHLQIGYNRAARLIEEMEKAGAVSAASSNGTRTVLAGAAA